MEEIINPLHSTRSRKLLTFATLALVIGLFAAPGYAVEARGGDQVVIGREEIIDDDLYVAGNTVTIDGTVKGDVVAFASQIVVNGTVEGDLLAAGQGILLNGGIGDDMRAAGQAIMLGPSARVEGDLAVGALWEWGRKILQSSPPPSTSMAGLQPV